MKYAIFSDIHGNSPALRAALDDAEARGADKHLFLGDYYRSMPWPNETADAIRSLKGAVVIQGNGEGYLKNFKNQNQDEWVYEQFKLVYWSMREFTQTNIDYLLSLPETAAVYDAGVPIHLHHNLPVFFRKLKVLPFHSSYYRNRMEAEPFTHTEYLAFAKEALLSRADAADEIRGLPEGVYLFGHNHLQFHMEFEGRLFINPGSCGEPCDHDNRAAYTILERIGNDWDVDERRVAYDVEAAIDGLKNSPFTGYAPVWAKVIERGVSTGKDYLSPFLQHLHTTGQLMGKDSEPVDNDVWEAAVKTWDPEKLYMYM
jgi:predicted phosphodiesterase